MTQCAMLLTLLCCAVTHWRHLVETMTLWKELNSSAAAPPFSISYCLKPHCTISRSFGVWPAVTSALDCCAWLVEQCRARSSLRLDAPCMPTQCEPMPTRRSAPGLVTVLSAAASRSLTWGACLWHLEQCMSSYYTFLCLWFLQSYCGASTALCIRSIARTLSG